MELPSISLDRAVLSNLENALQKEWLITNGLGGYASSTVLGINTRKYHGLLIAAMCPPRDRRVFLTKLDEDIILADNVYRLGANEFQGGIFPQGFGFLREFSISPFPKYVYTTDNVTIQKTVFMPNERNSVIVLYNILNESSTEIKMRVFPLVNWRHFHSVTDRWEASPPIQEQRGGLVKISFKAPDSTFLMQATDGRYYAADKWVEGIYFREEAHRGESCLDDCYQPGYFETDAEAGGRKDLAIVAVAEEDEHDATEVLKELPSDTRGLQSLRKNETSRREDFLTRFYNSHETVPRSDWLDWLVLAGRTFITKDVSELQRSVIAGYHWFGAWGRDTFISLPGLMLVTGRFGEARTVLLGFLKYCEKGLIPNLFPDNAGLPAYNTVDATLWYINAAFQYLKYTGDFEFAREQLWETLKAIVENHAEGTLFNIHMDEDGLLSHGPQLTWLDASIDGKPVTPRAGKAVEVQALWYNALRIMELLGKRFGYSSETERYASLAERARRSFVDEFWNPEKGYLYDVIGEHERDGSLRPNQIIAAALDFVMLDSGRNGRIVNVVHDQLLTPCGLRTLATNDPRYLGVYYGDRATRDRAYHNGTVWPWLLGPLTTAFLKAKGYAESQREYAFTNILKPFLTQQILKGGLGTIGEIFDGNAPYTPRGCVSQAWSVAEPFRAYVEDFMQVRPKYEREALQSSG